MPKTLAEKINKEMLRAWENAEKDRLLVHNKPVYGAGISERIYYGIRRALINIVPAGYYNNKPEKIRYCECQHNL